MSNKRWIKRKKIIQCDVDDTLVESFNSWKPGHIPINDQNGFTWWSKVNWDNVQALRDAKAAGFSITVHSAGGADWAECVLEALEIGPDIVDEVADKPDAIIDDLDSGHWIEHRVYCGKEPRAGSNGLQAIKSIAQLIEILKEEREG